MNFGDFPNLVFGSSTKDFGNMSFIKGAAVDVVKNRDELLGAIGLNLNSAVVLSVQHGGKVAIVSKKDRGKGAHDFKSAIKADAIITGDKNIFLLVLTADCLPVFLYDPITNCVCLIHGSSKNIHQIIRNTVEEFIKMFKSEAKNILVLIGPSIGPCHYKLDLWKIAEKEVLKQGIKKENIFNQTVCNYEDSNYFSHRRAVDKGESDFRFANIIGIKE